MKGYNQWCIKLQIHFNPHIDNSLGTQMTITNHGTKLHKVNLNTLNTAGYTIICIMEVLSSKLVRNDDYLKQDFSCSSSVSWSKCRDNASIIPRPLCFKSFLIYYPFVIFPLTLCSPLLTGLWNNSPRQINHRSDERTMDKNMWT
jgi:hypothetical protein